MKLSIPEHIQMTEVDGQCVLLDCRKNRFYAVNEIGAEFLEQVKLSGEMRLAVESVSKMYKVPYERVERDMNHFVRRLSDKGLLIKK